jgi:hypothetical protein
MPLFRGASQFEALSVPAAVYQSWCEKRAPAEIHSLTGSNYGFGYCNNGD